MLELCKAGKLILELVDLSKSASSVGSQELFALGFIDTQAVPEAFNRDFEFFELSLSARLLRDKLVLLGRQALEILLVKSQLLR